MNAKNLISQIDRIDSIEVISFAHVPLQYVGLIGHDGRSMYIFNDMKELGDRTELGVLGVVLDRPKSNKLQEVKEQFAGGRVLSTHYLITPGFDLVSGVRMRVEMQDMIITCGDAPHSLFFRFGRIERGRPEFPIEQYQSIN